MLYRAKIVKIISDPVSQKPVLILRTEEGDYTVSIYMDLLEATFVASALRKIKFDRLMTYDLLDNVLKTFNISIQKISIYDVIGTTFLAKLYFYQDNKIFEIESLPSEAIVIASKLKVPIFINECVIEKTSNFSCVNYDLLDTSPKGKEWARYLEDLSPKDFGKYKM